MFKVQTLMLALFLASSALACGSDEATTDETMSPEMTPTPEMAPSPEAPSPDVTPEPETPSPDAEPEAEPEMMLTGLAASLEQAGEVCEQACANYAGDACLGEDFSTEDCVATCDYEELFSEEFSALEEADAIVCAEAWIALEQCLLTVDCEGAQAYFSDEEGNPCASQDAAIAQSCTGPERNLDMFSQEIQDAAAQAGATCVEGCDQYAGEACLGDLLPAQDCPGFCEYSTSIPTNFPNLTDDADGLACVNSFVALESCLLGLSCEEINTYFTVEDLETDYPCKAADEGTNTACGAFE